MPEKPRGAGRRSRARTVATGQRIDDIISRNLPTTRRGGPAQRYDLKILQSLRRIIRATDIYSRRLRVTHDLTAPQLICLLAVVEDGPLTPTLLAQRVHVSPSTVVGILDRLERKDLVTRTRSETDRRVVNIHATTKARRLARHAPSPLQENLATALNNLSPREQRAIARALDRLVDLMELADVEAAPILETGELNS
jgi:DNA-binding MarR family transcriptional regulator